MEIFSHLGYNDLLEIALLNKDYKYIMFGEGIWVTKFSKRFGAHHKKFVGKSSLRENWLKYIRRLAKLNKIVPEIMPFLGNFYCLKEAIRTNNIELLDQLLNYTHIDEDFDALDMACNIGNMEMVQKFADYNVVTTYSWHCIKAHGLDIEGYKNKLDPGTRNETIEVINHYVTFVDGANINSNEFSVIEVGLELMSRHGRDYQLIKDRLHTLGFYSDLIALGMASILMQFGENELIYQGTYIDDWEDIYHYIEIRAPIVLRDDLELFKFIVGKLEEPDEFISRVADFCTEDSKILAYIEETWGDEYLGFGSQHDWQDFKNWKRVLKPRTEREIKNVLENIKNKNLEPRFEEPLSRLQVMELERELLKRRHKFRKLN